MADECESTRLVFLDGFCLSKLKPIELEGCFFDVTNEHCEENRRGAQQTKICVGFACFS